METGVSVDFDIPNDINEEDDEEDEEEEKQREKELQELLTTAFDDLNDEEGDGSIAEEERSILSQPLLPQPTSKWPLGMYNETSTPRHEVPPWSVNYTPITNDLQQNHYFYTPYTDLNQQRTEDDARTLNVPNAQLLSGNVSSLRNNKDNNETVLRAPQYDAQRNGHAVSPSEEILAPEDTDHFNPILHQGKSHLQFNKQSNSYMNHQARTDDVFQLKTAMERSKEESDQNIRLLKHQLALTQGEKEGLVFSLQQARQLLVDKDRELDFLHSKAEKLEEELKDERATNEALQQKFEVSESLVSTLQQQVSELSSYKKLTKVQDSQERLMQCLKEKNQKEVLELKEILERKNEELERVEGQLKFLEQYFQQTIPERMEAINRLSQNLETVQNNCQKLLGTDSIRDVEKLRLQQNEREKLEQLNNAKIQNLMESLGELGNKIGQVEKMEMIPLVTHTKLLSEVEVEKNELETKLKNAYNELKDVKERNNKLIVENSKVKNEVEVLMKKHDTLMKSAIEKYHSLHKSEMENCKSELTEKFEADKSILCSFYEEKIGNLRSELKQANHSQDEVKEMYIKVCEERNELEARLQKPQTVEGNDLQKMQLFYNQEVEKRLNKEKILWDEAAAERYFEELSKTRKNWERLQASAVMQAKTILTEAFTQQEMLLLKKQETAQKKFVFLQKKVARLHQTLQQHKVPRWEDREKQLRAQFLQEQGEVMYRMKDELNRQWQGRLNDVQELYRSKLNDIQEAQKVELDNIMDEVKEAMLDERGSILSKHKEIVVQLKTEISKLHERLQLAEGKKAVKHDASVSCSLIREDQKAIVEKKMTTMKRELLNLQKEREKLLLQYHSVLNSLKKSQEQEEQLRKLCRKCQQPISETEFPPKHTLSDNIIKDSIPKETLSITKKRNVFVQTEEKIISREKVRELTKAYANIIHELAEEVTRQLAVSSRQQANSLRLFIMQYYNTINLDGT